LKRFHVLLNGENFIYPYEDELRVFGFYVARAVSATSCEEAVEAAIDSIWSDSSLKDASPRNKPSDPPRIHAEEIREVGSSNDTARDTGLVLYLSDQH
jgi:hypothetical protein